jgi:hypothetical protein
MRYETIVCLCTVPAVCRKFAANTIARSDLVQMSGQDRNLRFAASYKLFVV